MSGCSTRRTSSTLRPRCATAGTASSWRRSPRPTRRRFCPPRASTCDALEFPVMSWMRRLWREERPDVVHANWLPSYGFLAALLRLRPLVAMAWGSDVYGATRCDEGERALRHAARERGDERLCGPRRAARRDRRGSASDVPAQLGGRPGTFTPRTSGAVRRRSGCRRRRLSSARARCAAVQPGRDCRTPSRTSLPPSQARSSVQAHRSRSARHRTAALAGPYASSGTSPTTSWPTTTGPRSLHLDPRHRQLAAIGVGGHGVGLRVRRLRPPVGARADRGRLPRSDRPGRAEAVGGAIRRLLAEPGLAERIGAEARSLVERHRDQRVEMDRLSALYDDLSTKGRAR